MSSGLTESLSPMSTKPYGREEAVVWSPIDLWLILSLSVAHSLLKTVGLWLSPSLSEPPAT